MLLPRKLLNQQQNKQIIIYTVKKFLSKQISKIHQQK